jgi:LAO/AO transport system kinase
VAGRRDWTRERLVDALRAGDRRALARAITLVENGDPLAYEVVSDVYPRTGNAYAVGITGPPGVGKSSLVSALIRRVRADGTDIGVISVDPSSPFTHGALLGDRIRLADHFLDPGVFIRSMGTRGHLGGLAETTLQTLLVLDAAGKDVVFLETVGTGQSEVGVISIADTVVLVLMPGSGDSIQALKAGIMEIPDVIAINKMDHPLAKAMLNEVRQVLSLGPKDGWRPPIVLTEAMRGEGVDTLWGKIQEHREWLEREGELESRRRRNLATEVFQVAATRARRHLEEAVQGRDELLRLLEDVQERRLDPLTAVREILEKVFRIGDGDGTHAR